MIKTLVKKQLVKKLGKKKGGFTLIELIVVIAILGILAAILIPVVGGFIGSAKTNAANADARSIFTAAQATVANSTVDESTVTAVANVYDPATTVPTTRVATKIYFADISGYIGSAYSFNTTATDLFIYAKGGNLIGVTVKEKNGTTGTYGSTT